MKIVVVPTTMGIPQILSSSLRYYHGFLSQFLLVYCHYCLHYCGNYRSITAVLIPMSLFSILITGSKHRSYCSDVL